MVAHTAPTEASTAERLEQVALELFSTHGYDEVTTEQIAEAAGVSARTFFRHFPTKLAVLIGDIDERTRAFVNLLHRQSQDLSVTDALIETIATDDEASPVTPADLIRSRLMRETPSLLDAIRTYEADFEALLSEWIAQRTGRSADDFEVRVVAAAFVAARRVVVEEWQRSEGSAPIVELARQALSVVSADFG
ncbi:MAG: helix-turn-helix domain-containing protein [Actinomycetota bacterium]